MQDPSSFPQIRGQPFPEHEHLKCPRCDSMNTKFCYYNNYNLSQPRHFCKSCRRYWTKGGTLRNVPVGGGTRKNAKRASNKKSLISPSSSSSSSSLNVPPPSSASPPPVVSVQESFPAMFGLPSTETPYSSSFCNEMQTLDSGGSFSPLLTPDFEFGNLVGGVSSNMRNLEAELNLEGGRNNSENLLAVQGGGDFNGTWPDLAIYTPGSTFL